MSSLLNLPDLDLQPNRYTRVIKPPSFLQEYHCNLIKNTTQSHNLLDIHVSSQSEYPLSSFISYYNFSIAHTQYILNMSSIFEPTTYEKDICDENWSNSIQSKLTALIKSNT